MPRGVRGCVLPARGGENAQFAGELGERVGVLRNRERLSDARGRDGLAQRQLLDEPCERERRQADHGRDEEDDVKRIGERADVGVVHGWGKLREGGRVEVPATKARLPRERLCQVVSQLGRENRSEYGRAKEPPIERNSVAPEVATPSWL